MKTFACSLTAIVGLARASAALGASAQERVSGTVISSDIQGFVVETATKERVAFHMEAGKPKIGEKVTVHYDPSRRDHRGVWFAMDVQKTDKSSKGSINTGFSLAQAMGAARCSTSRNRPGASKYAIVGGEFW